MMKLLGLGLMTAIVVTTGCTTLKTETVKPDHSFKSNGRVSIATAWAKTSTGGDAFAVGRKAAESLKSKLNGVEPQVVILAESFAEKADKAKAAKGVASVFGKERVVGFATYGFYTRDGVVQNDGVGLLALGGDGITVRTAFVPKMNAEGLTMEKNEPELKEALGNAGRILAEQLPVTDQSRLMIVMADAHSPKNQFLVDGIQTVVGKHFPLTGGSANKHQSPKMNWLHWRGGLHTDAAIALMIDGNITIAQNGAQAKDNQAVLDTAKKVAEDVREALPSGRNVYVASNLRTPNLFLAFDCTGRRGKLDSLEDGLKATLEGLATPLSSGSKVFRAGVEVPMPREPFSGEVFGVWCAGEIGCADDSLDTPVGRGWHLMGTLIGHGRPGPVMGTTLPPIPSGLIRSTPPGLNPPIVLPAEE